MGPCRPYLNRRAAILNLTSFIYMIMILNAWIKKCFEQNLFGASIDLRRPICMCTWLRICSSTTLFLTFIDCTPRLFDTFPENFTNLIHNVSPSYPDYHACVVKYEATYLHGHFMGGITLLHSHFLLISQAIIGPDQIQEGFLSLLIGYSKFQQLKYLILNQDVFEAHIPF